MGIYQTAELTDTACVIAQLKQEIRDLAHCRGISEAHPFGSTVAVEEWPEIELAGEIVELPIETEVLPVSARVRVRKDGCDFDAKCTLASCNNGKAIYAVAVEG